jgi:hypothetical protein
MIKENLERYEGEWLDDKMERGNTSAKMGKSLKEFGKMTIGWDPPFCFTKIKMKI